MKVVQFIFYNKNALLKPLHPPNHFHYTRQINSHYINQMLSRRWNDWQGRNKSVLARCKDAPSRNELVLRL